MTIEWDFTHGKARGAYSGDGRHQLYVRESLGAQGVPTGGWRWLIDGVLMGVEGSEAAAKAAAEAAVRGMDRTHAGRLAAPANQRRGTAA